MDEDELIPRKRKRERKRERGREEVAEVKNKTAVGRKIPREKKKFGRRDAERTVKKKRGVPAAREVRESPGRRD